MKVFWMIIFTSMIRQQKNRYCVKKGYCISEDINIREFKKVLRGPIKILVVEFEYCSIQNKNKRFTKLPCNVLATRDIDRRTHKLVYYSTDLFQLQKSIRSLLSTSIIRYHFTYRKDLNLYSCESLCNIGFNPFGQPSISKVLEMKDKNLKYYLESLIFRAIRNTITLDNNETFIKENLKRIRKDELYNPIHFEKVDFANPFILEFSREFSILLERLKNQIMEKYINIFEDYYVTSVYKGGLFLDSTEEILAIIRNSKEEYDVMMKTICDAIMDIIVISELMFDDKKVIQTSLYIDQSHLKNSFTFEKCFVFNIVEILMFEDSIIDRYFLLTLKNDRVVEAEAYSENRIKFIVLLGDLDYSDVLSIYVKIICKDKISKCFWVKIN